MHSNRTLSQISFSFGLVGFVVGVFVGYGLLSGDSLGRVNLLFLLALFAFLPVLGLILSLFLLVTGGRKGLAGWILELPVLPKHYSAEILNLDLSGRRKSWLFYQTQLLTLSFAGGGLLVYFLLLIGTDISFVWRSTLLEASDLLPVLNTLALPWFFWGEAQPSLELLQQTQDFRLSAQTADIPELGQWWKYILAAQLTYNLIPRSIMLVVSRQRYQKEETIDSKSSETLQTKRNQRNFVNEERDLAPVVNSVNGTYALLDWAGSPPICHDHLNKRLGNPVSLTKVDPLKVAVENREGTDTSAEALVVLVKAWEPPMGELQDFLSTQSGPEQKLILPMDWDDESIRPVKEIHLDEWRRFGSVLSEWKILQLEEPE